MEILSIILTSVFGSSTILGFILYGKANRRLKNAEADRAAADVHGAEVERLTQQLDHQQVTIDKFTAMVDSLTGRLSKLNATVDKHIDRNRELSDRLYKSETELNRANERITVLTGELGEERLLRKHYQTWRCERSDCKDPRGPKPPRSELEGVRYLPPKRDAKSPRTTD